MGSRAGYRVRCKGECSQILRQQWQSSLEECVSLMWSKLGGEPDNGAQAIRDDLDIGRGFAALVVAFYQEPFNSIEPDTKCDIGDNGLFTVDISNYKNWVIYQQDVEWETGKLQGEERKLAEMNVSGFDWFVTESEREKIGEGIS